MILTARPAARLVGLGLFAAALGCGQSSSSPPPAKTPPAAVAATPTDARRPELNIGLT